MNIDLKTFNIIILMYSTIYPIINSNNLCNIEYLILGFLFLSYYVNIFEKIINFINFFILSCIFNKKDDLFCEIKECEIKECEIKECEIKDKTIKKIDVIYEDKYLDNFNLLKPLEIIDESFLTHLSNCILFENTPLGNVIMYYKFYTDETEASSFTYYCDNNIPYRILDSIAKKYCLTFKCKNIYIDINEELKKYEEKIKEKSNIIENDKNNSIIKSKKIFANFKSYNDNNISLSKSLISNIKEGKQGKQGKQGEKMSKYIENDNNLNKKIQNIIINNTKTKIIQYDKNKLNHEEEKNNDDTSEENNFEKNKNKYLKEKSNRYTYLGKLANFSFITKNLIKKEKVKNITYKQYKIKNNTTK